MPPGLCLGQGLAGVLETVCEVLRVIYPAMERDDSLKVIVFDGFESPS